MAKRAQNTKKNLVSKPDSDTILHKNPNFSWESYLLLAIPAFLMLFVYSEQVMDRTLITKYLALCIFLLGLSIWALIKNKLAFLGQIAKENAFFWVYFAFILFSGISLFNARLFGDGFINWSKIPIGMIFSGLLISYYIDKEDFKENVSFIISIFTLIGGIVALFQFFQLLQETELTHQSSYQINGLFSHKNILGEVFILCFPFNLFGVFYNHNAWKKYAAIAASFISLAFCIGLFSRAIWLALVFSSIITFIFYVWNERKNIARKNVFKFVGIGILFFLMSFILLGLTASFEVIFKRFHSITNIQDFANQERLLQWKNTMTLFYQKPFFGIGMENWKIQTMQFPIPAGIKGDMGDYFFQRPHNDYLWILSESGIFAFIFWLSIFGMAYFYIYKTLQKTDNQEVRNWLYLLFSGLTAYCVFATFSFPKERMEDIFLLNLIFVGILVEKNKVFLASLTEKPPHSLETKSILAFSILLVIISLYIGYERFDGEMHYKKYNDLTKLSVSQKGAEKQNTLRNAIQEIYRAYRPLYKMNPVSTPLKYFSGTKHLEISELEPAMNDLKEAYEICPYHPQILNNMGAAYAMQNNGKKALEYASKATELAPRYQDALLSSVILYAIDKNFDKSFEKLAQIDTTSQNPKYLFFNKTIRDSAAINAAKNIEEPFLKSKMLEIMRHRGWADAILKHAKDRNTPLSFELRREAILMMKKDKNLSEAEWVILAEKYLHEKK